MNKADRVNLRRFLPIAAIVATLAIAAGGAAAGFVYAGIYDIGADAPHTKPVFWLIEQFRDRSIAVRSKNLAEPADLADSQRIAAGGQLYASLCTGCHLAPGMKNTDLSRGLYPKAPQLAYGTDLSPAEEFWIVKHGIKLTAMPAWGRTHDDVALWNLVAFLNAMPLLDPAGYRAATNGESDRAK
jgi:mono/diheme cytochrome c family protein